MNLNVVVLALAVSGSAVLDAAAPADTFRVTGIVSVGTRNVALVELPDGSQQRLQAGDPFAGGQVLEVTPTAVRIGFEKAPEQIVSLQGAAVRPGPPAQPYVQAQEAVPAEQPQQVLQREVPDGRLEEALGRIAAGLQEKPAGTAAGPEPAEAAPEDPPPAGAGTESELTRLLAPLVELPEGARVVGIDHEPIASTLEGIERIRHALATGSVVRINIESNAGAERIYLMPNRRGP